jgi:Tfp pilus assembly protein PilV
MTRFHSAIPRQTARRHPRGFTLIETAITSLLLSALFLTAIPTIGWIVRTRQAAERHQVALLAVGNLMERITSLEWSALTPERLSAMSLPESVSRQLPDAALQIAVESPADESDVKQISIELRWPEAAPGTWSAPVRLTAFAHERAGRGE